MIAELTKKQEQQIPKFIEKYISMASKKIDRKKATLAVQELYKSAGQEKPIVIFGQSPFQTALMVAICKILFKNDLVKDDSQLDSQLRSQLYSQLDSQLYSQLDSQLDSQLSSQLKNINSDWWLCVWWLVWAGWYSFGKYIGIKFNDKDYKIFMDFVENVSFCIPYKGICFVSENPEIDWKNSRLHNTEKGAVRYEDGYSLYAINGVKFTEEQFKKAKKAKLEEIIAWEDIDQRSALLSETPIEKLLKKVDKKLIDQTKECGGYKLYEIELKNIGKARLLSYKSWSTNKTYAKFVPPTSEKCLETVASLRHQTVGELISSYKNNKCS